MTRIAIIPARGGSKRIPGKNVRDFHGKPILAYSIEAAAASGLFNEIMVSTDSDSIAETAIEYGASVPFLRSPKSSDDYAPLVDVLIEVMEQYAVKGVHWEIVCCILPTAPFVRGQDLLHGYEKMEKSSADAVVSITRFSYPIQRALQFDSENCLSMVHPEHAFTRSQDLAPRFHDAGQFYIIKGNILLRERTLFCSSTTGYELEELRVQDIDTENDWKIAEMKYSLLRA